MNQTIKYPTYYQSITRSIGDARQPTVKGHEVARPRRSSRVTLVRVPGGGDGLVQPVRAELGVVGDDGTALLHGGVGESVPLGTARDLQQRSRVTVHQ